MLSNSRISTAIATVFLTISAVHAQVSIEDSVSAIKAVSSNNYSLTAIGELTGFEPVGASKLVLTVSCEGTQNPRTLTASYGGVAMTQVVQAVNPNRNAYVFYRDLNSPIGAGNVQLTFSGTVNGVGVSLLSLSGTAPGVGAFSSNTGVSTSLTTTGNDSLVVAASSANSTASATVAQSPLTSLLTGFTGSASGASGYQQVATSGTLVTSSFSVNNGTATASAEFLADVSVSPPALSLGISRNGTNFDFEWNSQTGKVYDLVSSPDLSTAVGSWSAYDDGVTIYENIVSNPPTNSLSDIPVQGSRRFFSVVEKEVPPLPVERIRVFLVGGQSNADGRADVAGLPTSPVNLKQAQDDVDFYYKVENQAPALTTLRPGLSETGGFGPSITFGRSMADDLGNGSTTRVAIIKYANGGTNLNVDWFPGGDGATTGDGPEYVTFQQTVTAGIAALASAYPSASVTIEGMIWVQGESDIQYPGGPTAWNNYQTNLTTFLSDVRATFGASLPFVIVRLSSGQTALNATGLSVVRAAQEAVADGDAFADWVNTDGFGMKGDNLHFDDSGQQSIGNTSATKMLNFVSP